jgi:hypothetical protein
MLFARPWNTIQFITTIFMINTSQRIKVVQPAKSQKPTAIRLRTQKITLNRPIDQPAIGMSLTQRLRQLQIPSSVPTESLAHLTLPELATEVITFGTKHQGETYESAWKDTEWVMFMLSRYQTSTKESHRRFIRFTELKIEALEKGQETIHRDLPVLPNHGRQTAKAKAKPLAKSLATPSHTSLPDGEEDWDIEHVESEMYNPGTMNVPPMVMAEDMHALQTRMLHMENALTRVIAFIENQSIQNQEFHPEDA